jgi:hypothetical protein
MQRKKVKFIFSDQPDGYIGAIQDFSHPSWKEWISPKTTKVIEPINKEFKRRVRPTYHYGRACPL